MNRKSDLWFALVTTGVIAWIIALLLGASWLSHRTSWGADFLTWVLIAVLVGVMIVPILHFAEKINWKRLLEKREEDK